MLLIGCWWRHLSYVQRILFQFGIVVIANGQYGRAGLAIPAAELSKIDFLSIFHCLHEVIAGSRAAVMTFKIELHAFLEVFFSQQRVQHTNHL